MFKKGEEPSDFCFIDTAPEKRLSHLERLTLTGGEELERALSWIARQFLSFSISQNFASVDIGLVKEAAAFYGDSKLLSDPSSFFEAPTEKPRVVSSIVHGLNDGEILDLEFGSTYKVQYPGFKNKYEECENNRRVHARMWRHTEGAKATVIAIHGWTMGDQRVNSIAFLPGIFYRRGLDVVLVELPFHGRRAPSAAEGGALFPSTDVVRTNEAMGQSISDLRNLTLYLESQGSKNIGWIGVSLGAYVGSLWSGLDKRAFSIPIVPMSSMPEMAWVAMARDPGFRTLKKAGLSVDLLRGVYRVHSPLTHTLKGEKDNVFIVGGIGDKLVPAKQVKMLEEHWGNPRIQWFRGGHAASLKRSKVFGEILNFLRDRGYSN